MGGFISIMRKQMLLVLKDMSIALSDCSSQYDWMVIWLASNTSEHHLYFCKNGYKTFVRLKL